MLELQPFAGPREGKGFVAGAVVGHDAGDRHAEASVIGDGGLEEGDRALCLLVRHDEGEGDPGGVVDADVDELPAGALASGRALLCPLRSPVMRWPTWWKRPSFLVSMWMSSPGCWRS